MDDFLDADCVINALFSKGVLSRKVWKLTKGTANNYDVIFEFADLAKAVGFTIYIKGTYHCLGRNALINLSRRFSIPVDDIVLQCSINEF
jgi:prolyl oligopeptidase PreP (S9A serine peptidase family)